MTIADILFLTDKQSLLKIVLEYQLVNLTKIYFPQILDIDTEYGNEYTKLMMPTSYSGRVHRENGCITQKHYLIVK